LLSITNGALNTGQQSRRVVRILESKISVSLTQGTSPWIFQNNIFIHNSFFFSFTPPYSRHRSCQLFGTTTARVYIIRLTSMYLLYHTFIVCPCLSLAWQCFIYTIYLLYYPRKIIYGTSCFRDCMLIPHELRVNCAAGCTYVLNRIVRSNKN